MPGAGEQRRNAGPAPAGIGRAQLRNSPPVERQDGWSWHRQCHFLEFTSHPTGRSIPGRVWDEMEQAAGAVRHVPLLLML